MAQTYSERPSRILNIEDEYFAYCLDEAVADIISALRRKRKLRPKVKADNNRELIAQLMGKG